jgi:hypothetical protein
MYRALRELRAHLRHKPRTTSGDAGINIVNEREQVHRVSGAARGAGGARACGGRKRAKLVGRDQARAQRAPRGPGRFTSSALGRGRNGERRPCRRSSFPVRYSGAGVNLIQEISRAYAEVQRGSPGAREKLERLQAEYRTSGEITRVGGTCQLEGRPSAPFSYRARSRSVSRDVLNYGHPSSAGRSVPARPSPDRSPSR